MVFPAFSVRHGGFSIFQYITSTSSQIITPKTMEDTSCPKCISRFCFHYILKYKPLEGVKSLFSWTNFYCNSTFCAFKKIYIFLSPTVPKVQFHAPVYTGEESDGAITATVYRSGDMRYNSSVRCYTRQGSAQVAADFDERPDTDGSIISFLPGRNYTGFNFLIIVKFKNVLCVKKKVYFFFIK